MSHGRATRKAYGLSLAARTAAGRFASHFRHARGARHAWCPIILRWRRSPQHGKGMRAGRRVPVVTTAWFPQFHLHFSISGSDHARHGGLSRLHEAATIHQSPSVLRERQYIMVRAASEPTPRRRNGSPHVGHGQKTPLRRIGGVASALPRSSWPPLPASMPARLAFRIPPFFYERAHGIGRVGRREQAVAPFDAQKWARHISRPRSNDFRQREPEVSRSRVLRRRHAITWRSSDTAVRQTHFSATAELVWRHATRPDPRTAHGTSPLDIAAFPHRPARGVAPNDLMLAEATPGPQRAGTIQAGNFDSAFLDRLTDDVIRRVERRMRIERERRGL